MKKSFAYRGTEAWNNLSTNISNQGRRKIDNWGGGTFIYSCSQTVKTIDFKIEITISKEINCAEHEYMNIAPPPPNYRSSGAPSLTSKGTEMKEMY